MIKAISFNTGNIYPDPEILSLLRRYNLKPTGSREGDLAAIAKAKAESAENNNKPDAPKKSPPKTPAAVAEFMEKLGLTPTNSKEGDNEAITGKLEELEAKAKTEAERKDVKYLRQEFASIIASVNAQGMEQMATMNRFFMMK